MGCPVVYLVGKKETQPASRDSDSVYSYSLYSLQTNPWVVVNTQVNSMCFTKRHYKVKQAEKLAPPLSLSQFSSIQCHVERSSSSLDGAR